MIYSVNNKKKLEDRMSLVLTSAARSFCFDSVFLKTGYRNNLRNMSLNWESLKKKCLEMNSEDKRSLYKCGRNYKILNDLPTWEEYFKTKVPLAEKIEILGGFEVNGSKNKELAKKISIFNGDIVSLEIDCIVNAANTSLLGGGGVDGAIHQAAGPELKEECRSLNGCKTGEAKITGGYKLPAKYIIHTVGPRKEKPDLLTACYKNCLDVALNSNIRTIAFPCISTGIYGYPNDKAAHVAIRQVRTFLEKHEESVDRIIFCLFLPIDVTLYEGALQSYFPVSLTL